MFLKQFRELTKDLPEDVLVYVVNGNKEVPLEKLVVIENTILTQEARKTVTLNLYPIGD